MTNKNQGDIRRMKGSKFFQSWKGEPWPIFVLTDISEVWLLNGGGDGQRPVGWSHGTSYIAPGTGCHRHIAGCPLGHFGRYFVQPVGLEKYKHCCLLLTDLSSQTVKIDKNGAGPDTAIVADLSQRPSDKDKHR